MCLCRTFFFFKQIEFIIRNKGEIVTVIITLYRKFCFFNYCSAQKLRRNCDNENGLLLIHQTIGISNNKTFLYRDKLFGHYREIWNPWSEKYFPGINRTGCINVCLIYHKGNIYSNWNQWNQIHCHMLKTLYFADVPSLWFIFATKLGKLYNWIIIGREKQWHFVPSVN